MGSRRHAQHEIEAFIRGHILSYNFDMERLESWKEYMAANVDSNHTAAEAFCDYFELGNWFYEAIVDCDLDVESLMNEVEQEILTDYQEAMRDREEIDRDLRRANGWPW